MIRLLPVFLIASACAGAPATAPLTPADADAPAATSARTDGPVVEAGPTEIAPPAEPLDPADHIVVDEPDLAEGPTPSAAAPVAALLRARHTEDLPTREVLDKHEGASQALVWLSLHGESAAVRVRATRALGLYPDGGHGDHLASLFLADDTHPALRAAALSALASHDLETRRPYAGILRGLTRSEDPRVSQAATTALEGL